MHNFIFRSELFETSMKFETVETEIGGEVSKISENQ
jgi:hypothetical protein